MTERSKYRIRFFFEYGAGGCLWPDNDQLTCDEFGYGPLDNAIHEKTGKLSQKTIELIKILDDKHAIHLNSDYPSDPSLWRQKDCDNFNKQIDNLLNRLIKELGNDFIINDQQIKYKEDPDLNEYLNDPKNFKRKTTASNNC